MQASYHSPLEGESQKPSRQAKADAVGGGRRGPQAAASGHARSLQRRPETHNLSKGKPCSPGVSLRKAALPPQSQFQLTPLGAFHKMGGFGPDRDPPGPPLSMRIGIDIGGTFTDIVCVTPEGSLLVRKVPSTPDDYSRSVLECLPGIFQEAGSGPGQVREVIHGTTVATNAPAAGERGRTALITTQGFRDVLELRRIRMPELYNWDWDKPPDLVPRRLRLEVRERVDARGTVVQPLDTRQAEQAIDRIAAAGVESLAVCLINAYANPAHEEELAALVRREASASAGQPFQPDSAGGSGV